MTNSDIQRLVCPRCGLLFFAADDGEFGCCPICQQRFRKPTEELLEANLAAPRTNPPAMSRRTSDLEVLEEIQDKMLEELRSKQINPRVSDLLKAIELKMKLRHPEAEKQQIWDLINQLRKEETSSDTDDSSDADADASA